jgi:hypothetical protein
VPCAGVGVFVEHTVWRNKEARRRLEGWFDRFLQRIDGPVESREVRSRFGTSHVLFAGPEEGHSRLQALPADNPEFRLWLAARPTRFFAGQEGAGASAGTG